MIPRETQSVLATRFEKYPAVALVGPRQCGKTTLAQSLGGSYFDLEQEADRLRLDLAWADLTRSTSLTILDEAQEWPEIFSRLRGAIDSERDRPGRFLILGSVAPSLMHRVSESLAGRLAIVELSPLTVSELPGVGLDEHWLRGGYPESGAPVPDRFPVWHDDYITMLTQRDLPHWGLPAKPQLTLRLIRMLAATHGQLANHSQLASSLGLSAPTVSRYLDYLEGAFLIRRLLPYTASRRKRWIKSPRLYFRDTGILHALLGANDMESLLAQPWVGTSWEGFVVGQILDVCAQLDLRVQPYHLRSSDRYEIDLLLDFGGKLWAIEVKLTSNPSVGDFDRLRRVSDFVEADRRILISRTTDSNVTERDVSCSLSMFLDELAEIAR